MQDIKNKIRKNNRKCLELSPFALREDESQPRLTQRPTGSKFLRFWEAKPIIFSILTPQKIQGVTSQPFQESKERLSQAFWWIFGQK